MASWIAEVARLYFATQLAGAGSLVAAAAEPDPLLVSSTVKDLVVGSGLQFEDLGPRTLKGVPEPWRLFRLA